MTPTYTNRLSDGLVLTISARPLRDLKGQPLRLLLQLRQLAGYSRTVDTLTCSLATIMGVTQNTIRAWRKALFEAGYIEYRTSLRTGRTTFYLTDLVEHPSQERL